MIGTIYHICGGDGVELERAGGFHAENEPHPEAQRAVSKDGPGVGGGLAAHLYILHILRCTDAAYYVGTKRGSRVEHSSR
jgi:hypothetical protein